jgi:uncharacterized protein (TIGR02996 family)
MFEIAVQGPGVFVRRTFDKPNVIVGSSRSNDLPLRHPHVSRQHCRIIWDQGFHVEDLDSKNGTFVNGTRVVGIVALRSIDDIDIGPYTLTLVPLNPLGDGADGVDAKPVHPLEEKFLATIKGQPNAQGPRIVYADWLSGRGEDLKAQILRAQEKLRGVPVSSTRRAEVNALLSQLPKSEIWWRVLVTRAPIESCGAPFAARCPKTWDALRPTDQANTRGCDACRGNVFYCMTMEEAREHVQGGARVVVDTALKRAPNDLRSPARR